MIALLWAFLSVALCQSESGNIVPIEHHDPASTVFFVKAGAVDLPVAQYKDFHCTSFEQKGNSVFTVRCKEKISRFTISPLSKKIEGKLVDEHTISFSLPGPSYWVITVNDTARLFLFAEGTTDAPKQDHVDVLSYGVDKDGNKMNTASIQKAIRETAQKRQMLFFPPGIYKTGRLIIPSNAHLYLAAGAMLKASDDLADLESPDEQKPRGFINLLNARHVRIEGPGVIDGNGRSLRDKYSDRARLRLLFLSGCEDITISGITQRDPGSWNTQVMYSNRVLFKNVKQLNDANLPNTDGFDPDASSFVTIENCFGYCGDDNVAIKITQKGGARNTVSDITVRGCVFLTRKSSLKVGTESRGESFRNILFENNDVILSDRGMALYCADGALFDNIRYIDNRFEKNYPDAKRCGLFFQVSKRNPDSETGAMKNILVKDCRFFKSFPNYSNIEGFDAAHPVEVTIEGLSIGGRVVTGSTDAQIKANGFSNVVFKKAAGLVKYTTTPGAEKSKICTLLVNGEEVFVEKFKDVSYARFAFAGNAKLEIKMLQSVGKYTISPLSYAIPSELQNNTISFSLDRPRKLIVQLEGMAEKLFILADAPESEAPRLGEKGVTNLLDFVSDNTGSSLQTKQLQAAIDQVSRTGGTLYVPNGKYLTGTFVMRKNVTLYLESGALIQGSGSLGDYNDNGDNKTGRIMTGRGALMYFDKADNSRIMGRGVIAMMGTKIKTETGQKVRLCNMRECHNAGIYDVILRDAGGFTVHILHSTNITMMGYKIINDLSLPNEDGTDPDGCNNVLIDDVFMYTSDDAVAVKADHRLCEHVTVQNCVFWTIKSALKVGSDPYFGARDIVFRNNDVVHADRALALYSGKGPIRDVQFIDNKSEFVGGNAKRQLIVFQVFNTKENNEDPDRRGVGLIDNVQVINYTAYQKSQNKSLISGTVAKDGSLHKVSNVLFRNLVIEGKHCLSADDAGIILSPTELPQDPNTPEKELQKVRKRITLDKGLQAVENIRFE